MTPNEPKPLKGEKPHIPKEIGNRQARRALWARIKKRDKAIAKK